MSKKEENGVNRENPISRKKAIGQIASYFTLSVATMMIIMPSQTRATGSPVFKSMPPKLPTQHSR